MWRRLRWALAGAGLLVLGAAAADRLLPPDLSRLRAVSTEIRDRHGVVLTDLPAPGGVWRLPTGVGDVDPRYLQLLLAGEDQRFRSHPGVDPTALVRAAWLDLRAGRIVSGGSTLTMQTARLLEPHRRGVLGKLHDLVRAVQLEELLSKDQILAAYLTLAPFGGNVEGVRSASELWFGHGPATLSAAEAALLVSIPQAPGHRRPDRYPLVAVGAARRLLDRLAAAGRLPASWSSDVDWTRPLAGHRYSPPHLAFSLCSRLASLPHAGSVIDTTLDAGLQAAIEALVVRQLAGEIPQVSAAVLVVDNASRQIRASLGGRGPGFPGGYLDLTLTRRSPGSALKPFIYGMAFDALRLHPLTIIADAPDRIPGYAPHNFDYQYHGAVTAQTALRQSFNVTAVQVLARVGPDRFVAALRQAGARVALPGRHASLAVALGGLGISLSDMVMLYAAIADDGQAAPLVVVPSGAGSRHPFLGAVAIYYLRDILLGSPPPPGMAYAALTGARQVAFKTGTSYGFRDAWAVGYSMATTVGVWTGRVEGTPRPGAFGRASAAPTMLEIFDLLPADADATADPPPGAIVVGRTQDLPLGLQRLGGPSQAQADAPILDFPPPGAVVDLVMAGARAQPIRLRVRGGTAPFRWIVNGAPQAGNMAELDWMPDGPGTVRATAVDAGDHAASSTFFISGSANATQP